jgi:signal transduction histidine kinase
MPHGRLFWRVYLHGVLLLLVVAVAVALTGVAIRREPAWHAYPDRLATYLSSRATEIDKPELLVRDLARERELLGVEATIYRLDGSMVATNVQPPVGALDPEEAQRLESGPIHHPGRSILALPIRDGKKAVAYVAVGGMPLAGQMSRLAALLAAVLGALAVGSFPLARAITRPLDKLTESARRFGAGDLTARTGIKRRDEVGELALAFDEMADRLEKLVKGEKELLANVSHELRTPMARIRVALELAAEGDAERSRSFLNEIATDLGELERLVDEVLVVARLDLIGSRDGAMPLRRARVSARSIVEAAAGRFRAAHPDRTFELRLVEPLPEIDGDEALLRRAIDNLLDNAGKYSDPGKPVVLASSGTDGWTVEVQDQGIGIDQKDLANLFRPFFRTERSRARGTGGVGLGLALARKIVEAHGGKIGVQSAVGEGTTVRWSVPAAKA